MMRGGMVVSLLCGAALAACASEPVLEVRPVGVSARGAAAGDKLALGHAALALGNVGLALQEFRQTLRVNPASIGAISGIASCYDAMGRGDLARRYYQEALALAPADLPLLRLYAASLARHGATAEAQAVTSEIAVRSGEHAAQWVMEPAQIAQGAAGRRTEAPLLSTGDGPPVSRKQALADEHKPSKAIPKARLERISLGEIALVTTGAPLWVKLPSPKPVQSVRMLNAARLQGLAARHRRILYGAGWRSVGIGDASRVRQSSLILYPAGQHSEARRLAHNLRIAALRLDSRSDILVLLGRDRS